MANVFFFVCIHTFAQCAFIFWPLAHRKQNKSTCPFRLITFIFIWKRIYDNGYCITPKNAIVLASVLVRKTTIFISPKPKKCHETHHCWPLNCSKQQNDHSSVRTKSKKKRTKKRGLCKKHFTRLQTIFNSPSTKKY